MSEPDKHASTESEAVRERLYRSYLSALGEGGPGGEMPDLAPRRAHLRRTVRRFFPADRQSRVLELGCGHGALLAVAGEAGYTELHGVDASPEQVEAARRLGIAGVEQGDLMTALRAQADASLDLVVAIDVLEHLRRDELLALADEVARVLAPGGRLLAHVPNAESPFGARIRYADLTHELAFTAVSARQLLCTAGFRAVACHEDTPAVHGVRSAARALLWRGIRGVFRVYMAAETGSGQALFTQNIFVVADK